MKKISIILTIILFSANLSSQDFNWQYSTRLPYKIPQFFLGLTANFDYNHNSGDFTFLSENIPCCNFKSGNGIGYNIGISSEYWILPRTAIFTSIIFNHINTLFLVASEPYPYRDFEDLITEYEFNHSLSLILIEFGAKQRIVDKFGLSFAFKPQIYLNSSQEFTERNISQNNFFFDEKTYYNGEIPNLMRIIFNFDLKLTYDLNLGLGKYSEIFISGTFPLNNISVNQSWKIYHFSSGIKLYLLNFK